MCRQAKLEYADEVRKNQEIHDAIARERARQKYQKHYDICKEVCISCALSFCKKWAILTDVYILELTHVFLRENLFLESAKFLL